MKCRLCKAEAVTTVPATDVRLPACQMHAEALLYGNVLVRNLK